MGLKRKTFLIHRKISLHLRTNNKKSVKPVKTPRIFLTVFLFSSASAAGSAGGRCTGSRSAGNRSAGSRSHSRSRSAGHRSYTGPGRNRSAYGRRRGCRSVMSVVRTPGGRGRRTGSAAAPAPGVAVKVPAVITGNIYIVVIPVIDHSRRSYYHRRRRSRGNHHRRRRSRGNHYCRSRGNYCFYQIDDVCGKSYSSSVIMVVMMRPAEGILDSKESCHCQYDFYFVLFHFILLSLEICIT